MTAFEAFSKLSTDIIDDLHSVLWTNLVPTSGACESIHGEMIRAMGRISLEMTSNSNNNWIYGKFSINEDGYPQGYLVDFEERKENYSPDVSKCTTTHEELKSATLFDEMLNLTQSYLKKHPLSEWDTEFQKKLNTALEMARPNVPIGVISDEHWDLFDEVHNEGWGTWDDKNSELANSQIVFWIYRNPDLLDLKDNPLGKSVRHVFSEFDLSMDYQP